MSDNRPARYVEADGTVVYRASSLMMCDRMFMAMAEGYGPQAHPEWFQRVLDEGTEMEPEIIEMFEDKHEVEVVDRQKVLELEVMDGVIIRGAPDGATPRGLFEAKKFRESTWGKFKRSGVESMPWYPMQTAFYMHAGEYEECDFVGGLFDGTKIIDIYTHHLTMPPVPLKAIIRRIARLENMIEEGVGIDVKCSEPKMYPCPFFYLHDPDDMHQLPVKPAPDAAFKGGLIEIATIDKTLTGLNKQVKDLTERRAILKDGVKAWLELSGVEDDEAIEVEGMELKYHTSHVKGYVVEDKDRLTVTVKPVKVSAATQAATKVAAKKLAPKKLGKVE